MSVRILTGDCRELLRTLPDASIDSIVTDPPAGIGFMGRQWDSDKGGRDAWIGWMQQVASECLRVLKPGGHALVWAIPRTSHWTATAWENAGFEVRDRIAHIFGSGYPKSHNLSGEREGWGTALKPAMEDWWLLRKPIRGTIAANVLAHGTGALNIDACRIPGAKPDTTRGAGGQRGRYGAIGAQGRIVDDGMGRWPANVITDGSDEVVTAFPHTGADSAARFFYCAKASRADRDEGLEGRATRKAGVLNMRADAHAEASGMTPAARANTHPTVKPTALMRYLCRLVTPPGGTVLDPFAGSGTTGIAADREGFDAVLIEQDPEYAELARRRISGDAPLFAEVA